MDFDDIDFENRIVDPEELPDEFGDKENPLRPKNLDEYIGQERIFRYIFRPLFKGTKHLTMFCCTGRRDWARLHLPVLLQMKWE